MRQEWGYHFYFGAIWDNPADAFDFAIKQGDRNPDIQFYMPLADAIDWTVEPEQSLTELYRERAQYLRQKFDYLILMYSGGSDSHQVLATFLKEGIHLDEVRTYFPMKWVNTVSGEARPDDELGLLYEYHHAAVPGLRMVKLHSPSTKITVMDTTDAFFNLEEWYEHPLGPRQSIGLHGLYRGIERVRVARDLQRDVDTLRGKSVGVIYGTDKPYLRLRNREVSVFYQDANRIGVGHYWQHQGRPLYEPIMFYWGEPRITCKQAHIIKAALAVDQRVISQVDTHRWLIYPDWTWSYQQRYADYGDVLPAFLGNKAREFSAERVDFLHSRFRGLAGVGHTNEQGSSRVHRSLLLARQTRHYTIGKITCAQPSPPSSRASFPPLLPLVRSV